MGLSHEEISLAIIEAVSEATGTPIEELPLISDSIDPDAIEALVMADSSADLTVTFTYAGQRVVLHSDNTVFVQPIDEEIGNPV